MTNAEISDEARKFCEVYIAVTQLAKTTTTPSYTVTIEINESGVIQVPAAAAATTTAPAAQPTSPSAGIVPRAEPGSLPAKALEYPDLRISSVCSCLVEPSRVVSTMTDVAPAVFSTQYVSCLCSPFHRLTL